MPKPKKPIWYFHIHHGTFLERVYQSMSARIKYIKDEKNAMEKPLRLKLLRKVTIPSELVKDARRYTDTGVATKALREFHDKKCHPRCPWVHRRHTIFTNFSQSKTEWTFLEKK